MAFAFEKLIVWQKAVDFADKMASLTEKFPRGYRHLVDQLNRGSVQECVPLLELERRRSFLGDPEHNQRKNELEEIARMMSGLIKELDKQKG